MESLAVSLKKVINILDKDGFPRDRINGIIKEIKDFYNNKLRVLENCAKEVQNMIEDNARR